MAMLPVLLTFAAMLAQGADAPPLRESHLTVFGDDPCPQAADDEEIVVCARRPEDERYRIPAPFRDTEPLEMAWGSNVEQIEDAQRDTRPNSCSPVGSYGQTGCTQELVRQWYAERRARRAR